MKGLFFTFIVLFVFGLGLYAQIDESQSFVYLRNGQIEYGENLWIRYGGLINNAPNAKSYKANEIRFVNAENGFFAFTKGVRRWGAPGVAKRTISGRVNLFESQVIFIDEHYGSEGGLLTKKKYYNYYNTGYNDIQRISYKKIYPYFSSNTESLEYLDKYRSAHITQNTFIISGYAIQTGAFVYLAAGFNTRRKNKADISPGTDIVLPLAAMLTGYGLTLTSNWFGTKKTENLRRAFLKFNGIN